MIASLPMYDRPETSAAQAELWRYIRAELAAFAEDLPEELSAPYQLMPHWLDPGLAFSQTCGLPYRTALHGKVAMVGTVDYALPGCPPGHYNSVFVIRADDPRDDPAAWPAMRLAANSFRSQSGWAAPQNHLGKFGLGFEDVLVTGAHRASAEAVAEGKADIACIDAQTWRMIDRWDDVAKALREVGRTEPTPGLPFISALNADPAAISQAVARGVRTAPAEVRATLDIEGVVHIPPETYLSVPTPLPPAVKNGVTEANI